MNFQFQSFPNKKGYYSIEEQEQRWETLGLKNLDNKLVLDVGSAEGWFVGKCQQQGAKVIAIESGRSPEASFVDLEKVDWIKALFDFPFEERWWKKIKYCKFDYIFILRVLYHMSNPILALQRAYEVLGEKGCLFIDYNFVRESDEMLLDLYNDNGWMRFIATRKALSYILDCIGFSEPEVLLKYRQGKWEIWKVTKR